jgi:oligosaccharide repeat unit polymerase
MPYVEKIILASYKETRFSVLWIYIISVTAFLFGSGLVNSWLGQKIKHYNIPLAVNPIKRSGLTLSQRLLIYVFVALGCALVIQMYLAGAFSDYMKSFEASWVAHNMYTVLCEFFFFFFVYLWINYNGYKKIKAVLLILIFLTVLKGSRMFVVPLLFLVIYKYIYIDKRTISKIVRKMLLLGVLAIGGFFFMFFHRHGTSLSGKEIAPFLFLLVQFEACGVHIPLMKEILLGWHTQFAPMVTLISDTILFLVPRFIWGNKNDYLYFENQIRNYDLSPFGGMNGEASAIIYFGVLYPLAFFIIGAACAYIYKLLQTRKYAWIKPLYVYMCCSLMFTFLRNGVLNASKNMVTILILFLVLELAKRIIIRPTKNTL